MRKTLSNVVTAGDGRGERRRGEPKELQDKSPVTVALFTAGQGPFRDEEWTMGWPLSSFPTPLSTNTAEFMN